MRADMEHPSTLNQHGSNNAASPSNYPIPAVNAAVLRLASHFSAVFLYSTFCQYSTSIRSHRRTQKNPPFGTDRNNASARQVTRVAQPSDTKKTRSCIWRMAGSCTQRSRSKILRMMLRFAYFLTHG